MNGPKGIIIYKFFLILLLLVSLTIGYIFYLLLQPFTPPQITTPIPILNKDKILRAGEAISTKIDFCVYHKVSSTTTRRYHNLDDNQVFMLSTSVSDGRDPGCGTVVSNTVPVPSSILPGRYKIVLNSTFQVNAIKIESHEYETEEFRVVE